MTCLCISFCLPPRNKRNYLRWRWFPPAFVGVFPWMNAFETNLFLTERTHIQRSTTVRHHTTEVRKPGGSGSGHTKMHRCSLSFYLLCLDCWLCCFTFYANSFSKTNGNCQSLWIIHRNYNTCGLIYFCYGGLLWKQIWKEICILSRSTSRK